MYFTTMWNFPLGAILLELNRKVLAVPILSFFFNSGVLLTLVAPLPSISSAWIPINSPKITAPNIFYIFMSYRVLIKILVTFSGAFIDIPIIYSEWISLFWWSSAVLKNSEPCSHEAFQAWFLDSSWLCSITNRKYYVWCCESEMKFFIEKFYFIFIYDFIKHDFLERGSCHRLGCIELWG